MIVFAKAQPTQAQAQAEAGNYRKKHIRFQGLAIAIENPRGSVRSGRDRGGHEWSIRMQADYGYINGSMGVDGDQVDCYIGPDPEADTAFLVTTMAPPDFTKRDEQKVMLGYADESSAKAAYLAHYDNPKFFGSILAMPMAEFKTKVLATKDAPKFIKGLVMLDGKTVLFIKANVGPYLRGGKMVNLGGYHGRDKRAGSVPGQMALFPAPEKKPLGPSPFSEDHMRNPEKHTPDLFGADEHGEVPPGKPVGGIGDDHPAPIPRRSIAHLGDYDRKAWTNLHREQHELRYNDLHKLRQKMGRARSARNKAETQYNEWVAHAKEADQAKEMGYPGGERADEFRAHANKMADEYAKYRNALDAMAVQHSRLHERVAGLGKFKEMILPGSGDLQFDLTTQRRRTDQEEEGHAKEQHKIYKGWNPAS